MPSRFLSAALALSLLGGCTELQPSAPAADVPPDSCGAASVRGLVGQPRAALDAASLPSGSRVLGPNQPVTMDFRPERLNVEIGGDGKIARVGCY